MAVKSCRLYFLGTATFNTLHDSSLSCLRNLYIRFTSSVSPSRQLSPDVFVIPNFHTSIFSNSFYLSAIYFWHFLPDPVHSSPTIGTLKGCLLRHLFDLGNNPAWCSEVVVGLIAILGHSEPFLVLRYPVVAIARRLIYISHIAHNIAETCQKYFQSFIAIEIMSQYFCQILQNISLQHYNFYCLKYFCKPINI